MGNAGRVLMIPKGEYNSATTYEMLDFVYYQGRSYVCKQTSTGNAPTNTTYWQALTGDASAEIQALTNQVEARATLGAKNLLPVTVANLKANNTSGTWSGNDYTVGGITFAVQTDSAGNVTGINTNGTLSASYVTFNIPYALPAGSYILNGCPTGGSTNTYYLSFRDDNNVKYNDIGDESAVMTSAGQSGKDTVITIAVSVDNKLFKPMIRLATDSDPTYQPYAKTNVELTQDVSDVLPVVNNAIEITTTESFANLKNGITYKFSPSDTGSPFEGYNIAVIVAKVASTSGIQIAFKVVSAANTELDLLAIRPCLGGNYGAWRKFSGVIPT